VFGQRGLFADSDGNINKYVLWSMELDGRWLHVFPASSALALLVFVQQQ
jgi:hypothetical protein